MIDKPLAAVIALLIGVSDIQMQSASHQIQKLVDEKADLIMSLESCAQAASLQKKMFADQRDMLQVEKNTVKKAALEFVNSMQQRLVSLQSQHSGSEATLLSRI